MAATSVVSGLASGLDWRKIIDQLRQIEYKKIEMVEGRKKIHEERTSAWQSLNTKLLSLKNSAGALNKPAGFNLYTTALSSDTTTKAEDILSVTTSTDGSPGTYRIVVSQLASAQRLSSNSYASQSEGLNLSGDLVAGGRTVKISATDSLASIRDKINAVNTGTNASKVTASIVNYGTSGYRLILTSDDEGSAGMSLLNGGPSDLLGSLGFVDASAKTAKNAVAAGHKSDAFSAADKAVGGSDLLNLTSPQSGEVTITINGTVRSFAIDLATDSLNTIRDAINTVFSGVFSSNPASVVSETVDGTTKYRLLIEGNTITYTDAGNILETLGILKRAGVSDVRGVTGDVANTSGGAAITSSTLIKDIDGYVDYISGDTITLTGTNTDGTAVNSVFTINDATTIGALLTEIQTRYGEVAASITADGKIQIVNNKIGDTNLAVTLTPGKTSLKFDTDNNFGAISTLRSRQIQAGANASISVDGVAMAPSSNTADDIIPGVTLNLKKAASDTTVSLTVGRDYDGVKEKIEEFVTAYNDAVDAINGQLAYNSETRKPGGPLFGDGTLRTIKSNLTRIVLNQVSGVSANFSTLGLIGISMGTNSRLTIDGSKLQDYFETNFVDVKKLFAADWSSTNNNLSYLYHTIDTKAGTYNVQITGVDPVAGYFETPGDATGEGEFLKGINGNAKGLVVRYSGTATGGVGSFSLTYGIAELLDRSLYSITDSVDGTITHKKETNQDTIDRLEDNIETMKARLDQRMAELERRFVAMETALSTLQSQTSWLTGQINTVSRGWW
ncbi:MAG: flagellar filament capping protein FliD [Thermodesulfobacteriota bacterium]|nr:flagellar filament capping protein FliD [Thermodesulfobacteriota bacterium]